LIGINLSTSFPDFTISSNKGKLSTGANYTPPLFFSNISVGENQAKCCSKSVFGGLLPPEGAEIHLYNLNLPSLDIYNII
jgi:hypothetical protein